MSGGGSWQLYATACATTDSCVAVGYYDTSSTYDAYVAPITDGVPGSPAEVQLPANASSTAPYAELEGVACQSGNVCEAYGYYYDSADVEHQMVVQITNGVPAQAVEVTPPADTLDSRFYLYSISCPSTGACVVVGYYENTSDADLPLVVPISNGEPGTAVSASLPSDSNASADGELESVACQSASSCVAVGYYYNKNNGYTALVVPITNGAPGAGVGTLPADSISSNQDAHLTNVACPASGACEAIGYYENSSSETQNMVVPISDGVPGASTGVAAPAGAPSGYQYVDIEGLSCSSASLCVAAGWYYYDSSYNYKAGLTLITSSGATSEAAPLPSDASQTEPDSEFEGDSNSGYDSGAVSCAPSGPCLAAGWYYTTADSSSSSYSGLVAQISASGQVGTGVATPAPADSSVPQSAYLYSGTACDAAGSCVATGEYENSLSDLPYEVSEQAPLSVSTSSLAGGQQGSSYQASLSAAGAWGSYSWSVSSGNLPAGLSLDAQTGVISGTPTASGTASFTVQATAAGSPVQTAAQQLSIAVAPAAVTTTTTTTTTTPTPTPAVVKPRVRVLGHSGLVRSNRLGVRLSCSGASCSGTVKLDASEVVKVKRGKKYVRKHRTVVIGSARYALSAGHSKTLRVKLNATGIRLLAAAKNHRHAATIIATARGGNRASRHETIWTKKKK